MDLLQDAREHQGPFPEVVRVMGLTEVQVECALVDLTRKQRTTEYLRLAPLGRGRWLDDRPSRPGDSAR